MDTSMLGRWLIGFGLLLAACGGSSKTPPGGATVCTAGARVCDGLNVKVCNSEGTGEAIDTTCLPSQSCSDGVCKETTCVPNTQFCKDNQVYKCDSLGSGSTPFETCSTTEFCQDDGDDAQCADTVCKASEALCDDSIATKCKPDGSGPVPGGQDCAKSDQTCYQGACKDSACSEGEKICQHDDVYLCSENGSSMALLADCVATEVCDGTTGSCRPRLCEPGKMDCDATRIVACNQWGSGWEQSGTDCAADSALCMAGVCKKQVCSPSSTFCQDGNVYSCDASGISSSLYQQCDPNWYHCEPYYAGSGYANCAYNQCTPGQLVCDGDYVKTCTDTGSYPPNGTWCGSDKYCAEGECVERECEPYTNFCKNGDVYYCDYYGGASQVSQFCLSDTTCKDVDNGAVCVALPCEVGETACLGNKIGKCAEDGSSLASVTEDCTTSSKVCDLAGTCVASVEETLGIAEDAETIGAGNVIGDVIEVDSNRSVTEIEANLVLAAARELRWVIYEQSGGTFVARIDKVVSNQSGTGFFSSGPLDYTLKAGKRYLLAVAITGGNAIGYYDTAPFSSELSFGTPLGRVNSYYSSTITADYYYQEYLYQMRVTTELP